ncbi:AEC family transporter [Sediminispirochaeta bajacaliforniensis]|uniref:AEC family transporter n=1 Tax=Sediminispirochaeta bajacaliforniensis TaxID=148 RepID=UPI000378EA53|nr:AEC family transporter [Sediminispirochaeta bajacaliforniensis]
MYTILFAALARLVLFVVGGFLLFRFTPLKDKHLQSVLWLTMNVLLPIYFVRNFIVGWSSAEGSGYPFMVGFFVCSILLLLFQMWLGRLLSPLAVSERAHRRDFVLLFAFQNAGYVALPIMESFAPPELMIFMFFWIFGFNTLFWTLTISLLNSDRAAFTFKVSGPLVGILIGFSLSVFGLDKPLYDFAHNVLTLPAKLSMDLILVALGGILALIPKGSFKFRKDYLFFVIVKLLLYPFLMLIILFHLHPAWIPKPLLAPMKLALILQTAVPPSTNLMIATKKYGTEQQVAYIAGGEIITYPASVLTMPIILVISFYFLLP